MRPFLVQKTDNQVLCCFVGRLWCAVDKTRLECASKHVKFTFDSRQLYTKKRLTLSFQFSSIEFCGGKRAKMLGTSHRKTQLLVTINKLDQNVYIGIHFRCCLFVLKSWARCPLKIELQKEYKCVLFVGSVAHKANIWTAWLISSLYKKTLQHSIQLMRCKSQTKLRN